MQFKINLKKIKLFEIIIKIQKIKNNKNKIINKSSWFNITYLFFIADLNSQFFFNSLTMQLKINLKKLNYLK